MGRKYEKGVSGSVQEKNGFLHLVVGYKDPLTQQRKMKWLAMELPKDAPKSVIEKRKRDMLTEFEEKYARLLDGYDDPSKSMLLHAMPSASLRLSPQYTERTIGT